MLLLSPVFNALAPRTMAEDGAALQTLTTFPVTAAPFTD
jgi:hypothetical protein